MHSAGNDKQLFIIGIRVVFYHRGVCVAGGMEAARAGKLCGHDVELYEKNSELGGLMISAGDQKMKKEIRDLIGWYKRELERLKVPVHLNTEVNAEAIKAERPDVVILATGAVPSKMGFIKGSDKPHVVDCVTALVDKNAVPGKKVVVIGGGHVGCEAATEFALNRGKDVTIVEMLDSLLAGPAMPSTIRNCLTDMIEYNKINVMTGSALQSIEDDSVTVKNRDGELVTIPADNVVLAVGFKAEKSMADDLIGNSIDVYEIGNGLPTANILQAMQEGYEIVTQL